MAYQKSQKIKTIKQLTPIIRRLKQEGKIIILTAGVFDLIHYGHIHHFRKSSRLGDVLIVGVNSDASARQNKGDKRPINDEKARIGVLAGLETNCLKSGKKSPKDKFVQT